MPSPQSPIARRVFAALRKGTKERYVLPPRGRAALVEALEAETDSASLRESVTELVRLAAFLEEHHASPTAARELLEVAATAIPALQKKRRR